MELTLEVTGATLRAFTDSRLDIRNWCGLAGDFEELGLAETNLRYRV